jgi:hypothetical protein
MMMPTMAAGVSVLLLGQISVAMQVEDQPLVEPSTDAVATSDDGSMMVRLKGVWGHQMESDIDSGGKVSAGRGAFRLDLTKTISATTTLDCSLSYDHQAWEFTGTTGLGGLNPWDDVTTLVLDAKITHTINDEWLIYGGPMIAWSRQDGADDGDALIAGGSIGIVHHLSPTLSLGGGAAIIHWINETKFFPIINCFWHIADDWDLTTTMTTGWGSVTGAELIWHCTKEWDLGLSVAYEFRRFRLASDSAVPGGIGEATQMPLMIRATWSFDDNASLTIFGGSGMGGQLQVDNAAGTQVALSDYEPAGLIGLMGRVEF